MIENELRLFAKCKVSVNLMVACIQRKYRVKIRYQDVYNLVKQIKKTNPELQALGQLKEQETEFE